MTNRYILYNYTFIITRVLDDLFRTRVKLVSVHRIKILFILQEKLLEFNLISFMLK